MERTELKMALIAEQLGLSWAGECVGLNALLSLYKQNAYLAMSCQGISGCPFLCYIENSKCFDKSFTLKVPNLPQCLACADEIKY